MRNYVTKFIDFTVLLYNIVFCLFYLPALSVTKKFSIIKIPNASYKNIIKKMTDYMFCSNMDVCTTKKYYNLFYSMNKVNIDKKKKNQNLYQNHKCLVFKMYIQIENIYNR